MNTGRKSRSDVTAADDKAIGFDYQFYFFLHCLLNIKEGEEVGLEVKEDVHVDKPSGITVLSQLKHTVGPQSTNLTELDGDLWKTLYNWAKLIIEQGDNEPEEADKIEKQQAFCETVNFVLVTNKPLGPRNNLIHKLREFQNGTADFSAFQQHLEGLETDSLETAMYIREARMLDDTVLEAFMSRLKLETGFDDLLAKIRARLREMMIPESRIDTVLNVLDGALRQANFIKVKNREKVVMSFADFHKNYQIYFEIGRSQELIIEEYGCNISNPIEQVFIKQLIEIEDLFEDETDEIIEYTTHRLKAFNNLAQWLQQGLITEGQFDAFNNEAVSRWRNAFRKAHRGTRPGVSIPMFDDDGLSAKLVRMAQDCLDEIRGIELSLRDQHLGIELSNGQFYSLSDSRKIGWILDWKEKYGAV